MAIQVGSVAGAVAAGRRRQFDQGPFRGIADYLFESIPGAPLEPQALIARQEAGWVLPVHFHMQHQFQVVLRGSGTLGKHRLLPGSVHYTSPQSAYGPTIAGEEGLDYFTLRVLTDKGAWYLPEARPYMDAGVFKEQQWGELSDELDPSKRRTLIPAREDGLGAWAYTGHAGGEHACHEAAGGAGRFAVVIRGGFRVGSLSFDEGACVYWAPGDEAPAFIATEPDSVLVVVQFPVQTLRHHVPPALRIAPSLRS